MNFVLIEESGFEKETSLELKGKITIGRGSANAFQILDNKASRVHAQISVQDDNSIVLEDLNSSNGTFVNEQKVKKETLRPGDEIRIGSTILVIKEINKQEEELEAQPFVISSAATRVATEAQSFTCPNCSQKIRSKWKFCPYCGTKIVKIG